MVVTGERQPASPTESPATLEDATAAEPAEAHPALAHEPALDGLRGLAVAVVVLFHLDRLDGGFLGVDLFFLLSGFLITSLLLVEQNQTGRIDLPRFWARRVRRLLPALFVLVAGVATLIVLFTPAEQRPDIRGDGLATLGYVANWHAMLSDSSYGDMFDENHASPLDHAWSLAIEEQFYVLWPLVFLGAALTGRKLLLRRRVSRPAQAAADRADGDGDGEAAAPTWGGLSPAALTVAAFSLTGAVVSFSLLAVLFEEFGTNTNRAYYGTDTRIGPTLLGAGLAALTVHRRRRDKAPPWWLDMAAVAGLALMAWALVSLDVETSAYYRGGLVAFAVAALAVIVAVTRGPLGRVGQLLAAPPLRALGLISYGVYLWHWPVIVYMDPARRRWLSLEGWALDAARVAVSLGLALASYWLVEMPIRRGKLRGRALWIGGLATAAAVVAMVLVATSDRSSGDVAASEDTGDLLDSPGEVHLPDLEFFDEDAPRVLLVGDSGALVLGPQLVDYGEQQGVAVATATDPTCTIVYPEGVVRHSDGSTDDHGRCQDERWDDWVEAVDDFNPDVVVYYLGNAGMVEYRLGDEWVDDCDAAYEDHLAAGLAEEVETFEVNGATTYLLTSPYIGTFDEASPARTDCRNALYRDLEAELPSVEVLDLNEFIASGEAGPPGETFDDWVHLSPAGGLSVSEWLVPQVLP